MIESKSGSSDHFDWSKAEHDAKIPDAFPIWAGVDDRKEEPMSSQVVAPNSEADSEAGISVCILKADGREITPKVARYLLSMKLPASDEERCATWPATTLI